jgi:hypothetical protein
VISSSKLPLVSRSIAPRRLVAVPTAAVVAAACALTLLGVGTAAAQDTIGVRAIGGNIFSATSSVMSSFPTFCVDLSNAHRDCELAATGSIKVSSATKSKYKLPSKTIATGGLVPCGEGDCVKMKSTKAVRTKLKGVTRLPVTITLSVSSPVQETMSKQVTLRSTNTANVVFQTTNLGGDEAAPGGRGGRG